MKASHFSIGKPGSDMVNPKPVTPIDPAFTIQNYNIDEAKKRLSQASWTVGQSPMLYESIQGSSYFAAGKSGRATAMHEAKRQIHNLKARISSSSVMQQPKEPMCGQLY